MGVVCGWCGFMSLFITFGRRGKMLGSLTLVRILLIMAGVEQNPGPADKYIFRYQYLLIEIGTDVMRRIFDIRVSHDFGQYLSANHTENQKLQKLILAKIITAEQTRHLPPIDKSPKSSNFDITLLSCLLRNVCGLRGYKNSVWMNPTHTDYSLEADLARFKQCRNHLQHKGTVFISETDLKVKWNELSQILTRLNVVSGIPNLTTLINAAEKMNTDEEMKKRFDETIKAWIKMENDIEEMKLCLSELKRKLEHIEQTQEWKRRTMTMVESDLRNRLVMIYKEECCTLPVTPVCDEDEVEVELLSIYEPPSLYHVPYHRTPGKEEKYPISSYKEMFCKDDCSFRKIYITGDAGVGKTSFCKRMTLLWCKSQSGDTVTNKSVQNDIDFMAKFDFVFYLSLGETQRKDVVTMIVEQLLSIENDGKNNELYESVENILRKNECIIIMDAFDEWTPKENGKLNINKLSAEKCKFVITCRAYKIENERLSPRDIDRQVQMTGINLSSSKHYVTEIVNHINKEIGVIKNPHDFMRDVRKCKLTAQLRIPIIASHLVAVWFDNKLANMSRALIYSNIVDMLLKRAEKRKNIELPHLTESKVQFPDPLSDLFYLKKHISFLKKICLMSFNILFEQGKCLSDLIFTTEQLESEPYCVTDKEIDFLCKFGILSKTKVICGFGKREHKLSYLHKSYLDFFAALFVFSFDSGNAFDDVVKKWNTINDVVKFDNFFSFFVGFSGQRGKLLFENIYHTISDDLSSCRRNALSQNDGHYYKEQIKSLKTVVIHCLKEVSGSTDTILSFKHEDFIFGKNVISYRDNDDYFNDDEYYERYMTENNAYDDYCPDDEEFERFLAQKNAYDEYCPNDEEYERVWAENKAYEDNCPNDEENERCLAENNAYDEYCPNDEEYERVLAENKAYEDNCPNDEENERFLAENYAYNEYCPNDEEYERVWAENKAYEDNCPNDEENERFLAENDAYNEYCPNDEEYERVWAENKAYEDNCPNDEENERFLAENDAYNEYCPNDEELERVWAENKAYEDNCPNDEENERFLAENDAYNEYCPNDEEYERVWAENKAYEDNCPNDEENERFLAENNAYDEYCPNDEEYERVLAENKAYEDNCPNDEENERFLAENNAYDEYCPNDEEYERVLAENKAYDDYSPNDEEY